MDYLYREAQACQTAFERDGYGLALAVIGAVKAGEADPLTVAAMRVFGLPLEKYRARRAEAEWRQHQELLRCIPDYDPEVDHGHKLLDMADAQSARPKSKPAGKKDAHNEAADQRPRNLPAAFPSRAREIG